jgi:hypothetical protein
MLKKYPTIGRVVASKGADIVPTNKTYPFTFDLFSQGTPYTLLDRFAGELRPEILAHRVPALDATDSEVAFNMFGVAGADSWVHEGKYSASRPSPLLFNWRVLLGLTAYGKPYVAELVERKHPALAALVWCVAERALKQYSVCTYELFKRSMQVAYLDLLDPQRQLVESFSYPLKEEEKPFFMHHYGEQSNDPVFIAAVKQAFDRTYSTLSDYRRDVFVDSSIIPENVSIIYMERIRGEHKVLPATWDYPAFPRPPFGPDKPGAYLYELLYANRFRYRPGGVFVLDVPEGSHPGKESYPPALVINFNRFLQYRAANMGLYHKLQGKKAMSLYDLALCAAETFGRHYYGVLHDKRCGMYYELLSRGDKPMNPEELAATFVMPLPVLKDLTDAAAKYSVNYLVGLSTFPRRKREAGVRGTRRSVSAKSILTVNSPVTPYLGSSEFRITHRYRNTLISPPWSLTLADVTEYFQNNPVVRVAQHDGRVFIPLDVLRRLPGTQAYMTDELYSWLRIYDQMNKYVFKAELRMSNSHGINKLVRSERGTKNIRFRPEEDLAITNLYRPCMSAETKSQLLASCFGRSLRSISMRATILRNEMMAKGIYDLTQLPHGARTESILKEIRDAKKREAAVE